MSGTDRVTGPGAAGEDASARVAVHVPAPRSEQQATRQELAIINRMRANAALFVQRAADRASDQGWERVRAARAEEAGWRCWQAQRACPPEVRG